MTQYRLPEDAGTTNAGRTVTRAAWIVLAIFLAAFATFEAAKYGLPTILAALIFLALPDLTMLVGAGRAPGAAWFSRVAHRAWIPLVLLVGYSVGPVDWPPLFAAGLAWLTHIAVHRAGFAWPVRTPRDEPRHGASVIP
jgi:hypothetical protein